MSRILLTPRGQELGYPRISSNEQNLDSSLQYDNHELYPPQNFFNQYFVMPKNNNLPKQQALNLFARSYTPSFLVPNKSVDDERIKKYVSRSIQQNINNNNRASSPKSEFCDEALNPDNQGSYIFKKQNASHSLKENEFRLPLLKLDDVSPPKPIPYGNQKSDTQIISNKKIALNYRTNKFKEQNLSTERLVNVYSDSEEKFENIMKTVKQKRENKNQQIDSPLDKDPAFWGQWQQKDKMLDQLLKTQAIQEKRRLNRVEFIKSEKYGLSHNNIGHKLLENHKTDAINQAKIKHLQVSEEPKMLYFNKKTVSFNIN